MLRTTSVVLLLQKKMKSKSIQPFCEKCSGSKIFFPVDVNSVTMNSVLKYTWRSSLEQVLKNILTQHSLLIHITASILDVQQQRYSCTSLTALINPTDSLTVLPITYSLLLSKYYLVGS